MFVNLKDNGNVKIVLMYLFNIINTNIHPASLALTVHHIYLLNCSFKNVYEDNMLILDSHYLNLLTFENVGLYSEAD